jgi:hypothetical protein
LSSGNASVSLFFSISLLFGAHPFFFFFNSVLPPRSFSSLLSGKIVAFSHEEAVFLALSLFHFSVLSSIGKKKGFSFGGYTIQSIYNNRHRFSLRPSKHLIIRSPSFHTLRPAFPLLSSLFSLSISYHWTDLASKFSFSFFRLRPESPWCCFVLKQRIRKLSHQSCNC